MCLNVYDIRSVLAKLIIDNLPHFVDDNELKRLSITSPDTTVFQRYLSKISLDRLNDIRQQAQKIPLDPRSLRHHLLQVYETLVIYSPPDSDFSRSVVFIQFILEVCHRCLQCNRSNEIRSIHEYSSRLLQREANVRENSEMLKYIKYIINFMNVYNKFV